METRKKKRTVKTNTAHSKFADPARGLTWKEKRAARQERRQVQQQQMEHDWADKMQVLMEADIPERLVLPLLRKFDGDVDAILADQQAQLQQKVGMCIHIRSCCVLY